MLTIDVEKSGDVAMVRCVGRLVRGEKIRSLLQAVFSEKDTRMVVLDLSGLETLDGGGLAALLSLRQWALDRKVQLKLVNLSHFVREILGRTRLDRVFEISTLDRVIYALAGNNCQRANHAARA